MTKTDKF